jgi:hypothetical protein
VRRYKEKEQEDDSGREPEKEPCAPLIGRATIEFAMEFFDSHSRASAFDADKRHPSF